MRSELRGSFGMVASTHWLATAAGMAVLEAGGNAFDAAVATGLTLQVVEPHQNGPGGDMPALVWPAVRGEPLVLCAQGPAPAAAAVERYRAELGGGLVPGNGLLAAVVPGAFDGWMLMLRDFGTLPLRDVLRFAIGYAEDGFPAAPSLVRAIGEVEPLLRAWGTSAELWLPVPEPWARVRNRTLAATYRRLLAEAETAAGREEQIEAARHVYRAGFVGEALVRFAQGTEALDASGDRHRGVLDAADLAGWEAEWEAPVGVDYGELTVLKPGPWSQGPVFLQQLRLLEGFDLPALGQGSAEYVHTLAECAKLAFADREAWYGDPAFVDVPLETLLSRAYADERRRLVGEQAAAGLRPGSPDGRAPRLPSPVSASAVAGLGDPTRRPSDTCHLDVADRLGNLVSATPSGGWLTGSPAVPELGFCLGTRAQMFWLEEGLASSLAPGKRPRTTLSPTLVLRGGDPYLALGTPGGDQQDQWSLNALLGHVHFGLDLQAAIDAPQFHTEAFPSSFYPRETRPFHVAIEARLGDRTRAGLQARGHDVEQLGPWSLGRVSAAGRESDGTLKAAADARAEGHAAGR